MGDFQPCPVCKQYSHSIGEDAKAAAFLHFHAMIAHPVRGHPMGDVFDDQTKDAAQVLVTLIEQQAEMLRHCVAAVAHYDVDPTEISRAVEAIEDVRAAIAKPTVA